MLETFYGTGIRRSELARLNWRDLDIERRTLMVRQGKGRRTGWSPSGNAPWLGSSATWSTRDKVGRRTRRRDPVPDRRRHTLLVGPAYPTGPGLRERQRDHKEGACHLFRHTLATLMLEGGADIRYIQAMLGHAELSTTQIYTQVSIRALQAVHAATFPAASNTPRRRGGATLVPVDVGADPQGQCQSVACCS